MAHYKEGCVIALTLKLSMSRFFFLSLLLAAAFSLLGSLCACDWQNTRSCQWTIELDSQNMNMASPGVVAVCVKNHHINRQRCFLEVEAERFAQLEGQVFTYHGINIDTRAMPRKITTAPACQP